MITSMGRHSPEGRTLFGRLGRHLFAIGAAVLLTIAAAATADAQTISVRPTFGFSPSLEAAIVVECSRGPSPIRLTISDDGEAQTLAQIPTGAACRITESETSGFPIPDGCRWESAFYPGSTVIIGPNTNNLEVRTVLVCPPPNADLTIRKTVAGSTQSIPANTAFNVVVQCNPGGTNVVAVAAGANVAVEDLPLGARCDVIELPTTGIQIPAGCQWTTTYPQGSSATIANGGSVVEILNTLACQAQEGTLTVAKTVQVPGSGAYGQVGGAQPFRIDVTCTQNGNPVPVQPNPLTFQPAGPFQYTFTGLPSGAICQIAERAPTVPSSLGPNCRWNTTYPVGQSATVSAGADRRLEVRNEIVCITPPVTGSLTIAKTVVIAGTAPYAQMPGAQPFQIDVTCAANGGPVSLDPNPLTIAAAGPYQQTYTNLPAGTVCAVVERTVTVPSGAGQGCRWETTYPNGQNIAVSANADARVEIRNQLICPTPVTPPVITPPVITPPVTPPVITPPVTPQPATPASTDLGVTKTGPATCTAGQNCNFTVTITNFGNTAYNGPAAFQDEVTPAGATVSASGWFCSATGTSFTCLNPLVNLAPGASLAVSVAVAIPAATPPNTALTNCATRTQANGSVSSARFTQGVLSSLGYDVGTIDGAIGPRSRAAITAFQTQRGLLPATGNIDPALLAALAAFVPTDDNSANDRSCATVQTLAAPPPPPVLNCPFGMQPINGVCQPVCTVPGSNFDGTSCVICSAPATWDPQTRTCQILAPFCERGTLTPTPSNCTCGPGEAFVPFLGCVIANGLPPTTPGLYLTP